MKTMKIKNTRDYTDKVTGARQKKGAVIEVHVRRGRELIAKRCAEEVMEPAAKGKEPGAAAAE